MKISHTKSYRLSYEFRFYSKSNKKSYNNLHFRKISLVAALENEVWRDKRRERGDQMRRLLWNPSNIIAWARMIAKMDRGEKFSRYTLKVLCPESTPILLSHLIFWQQKHFLWESIPWVSGGNDLSNSTS